MNIVIPLAGKDDRFHDQFKAFVDINGKPLISLIIERLQVMRNDRLAFVVLKEHDINFRVSEKLKSLFGNSVIIRVLNRLTGGAPCSILGGLKDLINNEVDLLIALGDVLCNVKNLYTDIVRYRYHVSGLIPVTELLVTDRPWGYVCTDDNSYVIELKEKEIKTPSLFATMGLYYFSQGKDFVWAAETMIKNKSFLYNNTFFVGPVYNELIRRGDKVLVSPNSIEAVLSSPEDIRNFMNTEKQYGNFRP